MRRIQLSALDEGPGEGYHRTTTHEKSRACASAPQHLKQVGRDRGAYTNIEQFRNKYGARAEAVLRHDWRTWERALQPLASKRSNHLGEPSHR